MLEVKEGRFGDFGDRCRAGFVFRGWRSSHFGCEKMISEGWRVCGWWSDGQAGFIPFSSPDNKPGCLCVPCNLNTHVWLLADVTRLAMLFAPTRKANCFWFWRPREVELFFLV